MKLYREPARVCVDTIQQEEVLYRLKNFSGIKGPMMQVPGTIVLKANLVQTSSGRLVTCLYCMVCKGLDYGGSYSSDSTVSWPVTGKKLVYSANF